MLKNLKMRNKLILMFIVTGLIPMLFIGVFSYFKAAANVETEIYNKNNVYLELTVGQINDYFEERKGDAQVLATTRDVYNGLKILSENGINSDQWKERYKICDELLSVTEEKYNYDAIFLTDEKGQVVFASSNKEKFEGSDLSGRDYIKESLNGTMKWSELFYSDVINNNAIVLTSPVRSQGTSGYIVGTINIEISQEILDGIIHQGVEKLGKSGDAYLIAGDGTLLTNTRLGEYTENAALNEKINTKAYEILKTEINSMNSKFKRNEVYSDYLGNSVLGSLGVIQMGNTPAGLIIEVDQSEALAAVKALRNIQAIVIIVLSLIGILLAIYFARFIVKPLLAVVKRAEKMGNGDLSEDIQKDYLERKDEMGALAKAFDKMLKNMRELLKGIIENANDLSSGSEELSATVEEISSQAQNISSGTEEIAAGMQETSSSTEEVSASGEQILGSTNELAKKAQEGNNSAKEIEKEIKDLSQKNELY